LKAFFISPRNKRKIKTNPEKYPEKENEREESG
jgi:YHS domain-containing protein